MKGRETGAGDYLQKMKMFRALKEPVIKQVLESLTLPAGSKGLDAGCGDGYYTLMLAENAGLGSHVTGVDVTAPFLDEGRALSSKFNLTERISFIKGDIEDLRFEKNTFNWVFSIDCLELFTQDPVSMCEKLAAMIKPGGSLFMLNLSSQQLLPGYPVLEASLNATASGIAPFFPGMKPGLHGLWALEWLQKAGFNNLSAGTYVRDFISPFSNDIREGLLNLFEMRWGRNNLDLPKKDQLEYKRLCRGDSPDCILDIPGYYGFFTYSLFQGSLRNKSG